MVRCCGVGLYSWKEDQEFIVTLVYYIWSSRPAWDYMKPISINQKNSRVGPGVVQVFNPNTWDRGRQISVNSRSAWSTELITGQSGLCYMEGGGRGEARAYELVC